MPDVSVLIPAYNEEKVIERRIKNIAALNYDLSKVEVLIGSDCSKDRTNDLLKKFENEYNCRVYPIGIRPSGLTAEDWPMF